ncbi:MAG: MBL fold metallo-hydrolase [Negativicutes bacterium]|nr:MBL fold metallo-hydrolase [Negativicutes bacterium]
MKLTVVVDNCVPLSLPAPFLGEHGLALLLETGDKKILIDTGQSQAVIHNLSLLGLHPAALDMIVLSHGHYDHTAGLIYVLKQRQSPIAVYAHSDIFTERYAAKGASKRPAGIPYNQSTLTALGAEWTFCSGVTEILPGLWFSGQIPRETDYETGDNKLVICGAEGRDCRDPLLDDTVLYVQTGKGLVVIGGCTHSGMINAIEYGLKVTGERRLHGWIGGTHLGPASAEQQHKSLNTLAGYEPEFIAAGHCTGFSMMAALAARFGDKFITAFVGIVIEF